MPKSKVKSLTKSELMSELAAKSGLTKSQVVGVFDALLTVASKEAKAMHPLTIPGIVKLRPVHKAAVPAHMGRNPFTKEAIQIKAKPAKTDVRARAIKSFKDTVA